MKEQNNLFQLVLITSLVLLSCSTSGQKQKINKFSNQHIIGTWLLLKPDINYPDIIFKQDSTAVFTSRGDTVYRFKYYVTNSQLVLEDINHQVFNDSIIKLSEDTAIFNTLAENKAIQIYIRKGRSQ